MRAKSAALRPATVTKRTRFSPSQNLCSGTASGREAPTTAAAVVAPALPGVEFDGMELAVPELSGPLLRVANERLWAKAGAETRAKRIRPFVHRKTADKKLLRVDGGSVIFPARLARPAGAIRQPMGNRL